MEREGDQCMTFAAQIAQPACSPSYGRRLYYLNPLSPVKVNTLLTQTYTPPIQFSNKRRRDLDQEYSCNVVEDSTNYISAAMSADHSFIPGQFHQPNNRYVKDWYDSPIAGSPHDVSTPALLHQVKQEAQYDDDTFYSQYYPSQKSLPIGHLDISDAETPSRPPLAYHVGSNPQQYSLSQGGISQSNSLHNPSIHYPISRRPAGPPGQGYGKLTFIRRPDILGNVNNWSLQERQDSRRIVAFHKEIRGEVIQLDCCPVAAHDYNENMITISCIRWIPSPANERPHKLAGERVFTSVDIIILLEKLVGNFFDVQEKNRIRRNLEGYKPETVRKEGTTRQFFNQVMLYAQPKTRNIEKDIKVFLWKDLSKALKKVMQKYSKRIELASNTPSSEFGISSQALSSSLPNSQPSSTESLPTQRTFMTANNGMDYDSADYNSNTDFPQQSHNTLMEWQSILGSGSQFAYSTPIHPPSSVMAGSQIYSPQDESGYNSSLSISPTSQIAELGADYGQLLDGSFGSGQQALEAYVHDIPGDFAM